MINHDHISIKYKVILLGDTGVGKTMLTEQFVNGKVPQKSVPTVGLEFNNKVIVLKNGQEMVVRLWDTAGQERYRSLSRSHYQDADGALLVFDLTRRPTFESCRQWIEDFKLNCKKDSQILIVGNKLDLVQMDPSIRMVESKEGEFLARESNCHYRETSAMTSKNVSESYLDLMQEIYKKRKSLGLSGPEEGLPLNTKSFFDKKENTQEKKCC